MALTEAQVFEAIRAARAGGGDAQVRQIKIFEGTVSIEGAVAPAEREQMRQAIEEAVSRVPGVEEVMVSFAAPLGVAGGGHQQRAPQRQAAPPPPRGIPH